MKQPTEHQSTGDTSNTEDCGEEVGSGTREVAIKVFLPTEERSWKTEHELYRLRGLRHPNILYYVGVDKVCYYFFVRI